MHITERELNCIGLVLRAQIYGDKDLIFSIITEKTGKISAIAKGAKAGKKFSSGIPDILDLGSFDLRMGRSQLLQVTHFKPKQAFKNIRSNLNTYICACCWIEALDLLTAEAHQESHELYEIALGVLNLLNGSTETRNSCKILCEGLDAALMKTGFGIENDNSTLGLKKILGQVRRIEDISGRKFKSWEAFLELVKGLNKVTI